MVEKSEMRGPKVEHARELTYVFINLCSNDKAIPNGDDFHALMIGAGFVSCIITALHCCGVGPYPPVFSFLLKHRGP